MKPIHIILAATAVAGLSACSQTPEAVVATGAAADQACISAVAQKTGAADGAVEQSQTDYGASLVVVRAGGSLYRCKFSGGVIKDVSSVAQ
jgi:hypothetical protein